MGGAAAIVATATSGAAMSSLLPGLAPRGQLIVVGIADDPVQASTADLIVGNRSIVGTNTGTVIENEANVNFSAAHGIEAMTEAIPFDEAPAAYERMMSGKAMFRVVLGMQER